MGLLGMTLPLSRMFIVNNQNGKFESWICKLDLGKVLEWKIFMRHELMVWMGELAGHFGVFDGISLFARTNTEAFVMDYILCCTRIRILYHRHGATSTGLTP
ncbi:hypothetical protein TorRG33x02_101740 [Trema orientale]|uniref:Uncharacterized protein n=1 Tax=Trema orientale TaxID=63057 RepID=A0A2P5F8L2_TREOI|nr:hypothetical protein TorRG33x02_101740 [Trema orientale]